MLEEIVKDYAQNVSLKEIPKIQINNFLQLESLSIDEYRKNLNLNNLYSKYKKIDLEFLQKQKNGLPFFAVFTPKGQYCYIQLNFNYDDNDGFRGNIYTNFQSKIIRKQFLWLYEKLIDDNAKKIINNDRTELVIKSQFCGILEDKHRNLLTDPKKEFDEMILVAEAVNWQYEEKFVKYPPNPDPLIIGIKNDIAFLVEKFDLTNQEYYVSQEFTS